MLLVHFVRDKFNRKLKGGVLFTIYLQTNGNFIMNAIRCILTKHVTFSQLSHNHNIRIWGYFLKNFKKLYLFIEELYARRYHWYMFEALSLLEY